MPDVGTCPKCGCRFAVRAGRISRHSAELGSKTQCAGALGKPVGGSLRFIAPGRTINRDQA